MHSKTWKPGKITIALSSLLFTFTMTTTHSALAQGGAEQNETVIGEEELQRGNIENIKDAFTTTTGVETDGDNFSIRGVGGDGKGIAVTDDGVSLTDVSGAFSTDIDTSELEKLVVYKGPGSIYSVNGTGGVLKAKTKSTFKMGNNVKATVGSYGYKYAKLNAHQYFDIDTVVNLTASKKKVDNDYKSHSKQQDDRYTLKFGRILNDTSALELSLKYNDSYKDKIQAIIDTGFEEFKNRNTISNNGLWVFNNRDTKTKTIDLKYKKYFDLDTLVIRPSYSSKDQVYYNDGKINVNNDNYKLGADVEYSFNRVKHDFLLGASLKKDAMSDNYQYKYADITTTGPATNATVTSVFGTARGDVLSVSNSTNSLIGAYGQYKYQASDQLKLEASLRVDQVSFNVDSFAYWKFNGSTEKYQTGTNTLDKASADNLLFTPRLALTYAVNSETSIQFSAAQGERSINDTQLLVNVKNGYPTNIAPAQSRNFEIGIKHSSDNLLVDLSIYKNTITNEIIEVKDPAASLKYYESAGEIEKRGLDLGTKYSFDEPFYVGANLSLMDYQYVSYEAATGDHSGKTPHSIPDYRYALYAGYKDPMTKISAKVEAITSGGFFADDANTRTYGGYTGVVNTTFGWEPKASHKLMLNVTNLFDKRYATDASYSSTTGDTTYTVASPRTVKLSYMYKF